MVMYPNVGGFGAQHFLKLNDPELMLTGNSLKETTTFERVDAPDR